MKLRHDKPTGVSMAKKTPTPRNMKRRREATLSNLGATERRLQKQIESVAIATAHLSIALLAVSVKLGTIDKRIAALVAPNSVRGRGAR